MRFSENTEVCFDWRRNPRSACLRSPSLIPLVFISQYRPLLCTAVVFDNFTLKLSNEAYCVHGGSPIFLEQRALNG